MNFDGQTRRVVTGMKTVVPYATDGSSQTMVLEVVSPDASKKYHLATGRSGEIITANVDLSDYQYFVTDKNTYSHQMPLSVYFGGIQPLWSGKTSWTITQYGQQITLPTPISQSDDNFTGYSGEDSRKTFSIGETVDITFFESRFNLVSEKQNYNITWIYKL